MGVESDQMVFDYLSRVGDLAQTTLPASQRMQLVAQLRKDIDRERRDSDNPATVRRILGRIGSPDAVVEAASGTGSGAADAPSSGASTTATEGPYGPYTAPPPRKAGPGAGAGGRKGAPAGSPRGRAEDDDWWRVGPRDGRARAGDELAGLPGMTGGVFIPFDDEEAAAAGDDEKPLPGALRAAKAAEEADEADEEIYEEEVGEPRPRRRLLPRRRRRTAARATWGSPLLLLAAALLIAGAAIGSWIPLGLGWLAAYLTRQLTRPQAKFAVLGIPGTAAAGMIVWIWGRDAGKWGKPIVEGQMGPAFQDAYPTTVRIAAIASALYLLWRSRRPT